ncbi:MAG: pyridoxamine 5'-phosphate oxidase family protein [Parvibaculales bacterium]
MRDIDKTPAPPPLSCHDDLKASLDMAMKLLQRGASDAKSPLHTPVLASTNAHGHPQTRMVVLRQFLPATHQLYFHTDKRSAKIAEIEQNPTISLLFYDPKPRIQMRVKGLAALLPQAIQNEQWQKLNARSKPVYQIEPAPGHIIKTPEQASYQPEATDQGKNNFLAIGVTMQRLEWLYLARAGHRRAEFLFLENAEQVESRWLTP